MKNPVFSIILVNWNTRELTLQCIRSVYQDCEGIDIEIIVSDNASTDSSADAIEKEFPEVRVLRNSGNLGFAKGNNVGIHESKGAYVCLVNTDVEIIPGCFTVLRDYMDRNPGVGIAAPQALYADKRVQITARKETGFLNSLARVFWIDTVIPSMSWYSHKKLEEVDILAGCFWMIRREALEQVGLLDETFFFYGEDRDYCKRMRLAGWKVVYNPSAKIFHYEGGSSKVRPFHYYIQLERAYLRYWEKYHSGLSVSLYYLVRIVYHALRCASNTGACVVSFRDNKDRKHKALRSWYCIRMLTGCEKESDLVVQPETGNS